jgi:putative endopeptidase
MGAGRIPEAGAGHGLDRLLNAAGLASQAKVVRLAAARDHRPVRAGGQRTAAGVEGLPHLHAIDHVAWNNAVRGPGELPKAYADLAFGFHGTTLSARPRRATVASARSTRPARRSAMRWQDLCAEVLPGTSKAMVEEMVRNILAAFRRTRGIAHLDDAETKAKAREKAKAMQRERRLSDTWRDYSALEVRADDALGNRCAPNCRKSPPDRQARPARSIAASGG